MYFTGYRVVVGYFQTFRPQLRTFRPLADKRPNMHIHKHYSVGWSTASGLADVISVLRATNF